MSDGITRQITESYDRLADEYARRLFDELRHKPFDRDVLDRFVTATAGRGQVCDMGCGPGQVARYLHDAGAAVFGLDLSPGFVATARRLNPDIRFQQGDMLGLEQGDGSLAGIVAFYAIVNIPPEWLPLVFQQFYRVLQPGGLLLLAFHVGDEAMPVRELWGTPVSLDFFFFQATAIREQLEAAGFRVEELVERQPYAPEVEHQSRRAYLFARRPESL